MMRRPRLSSEVELRSVHPVPNRLDIKRYALFIKIHNDGELEARDIEGNWKCSASQGLQSEEKRISIEAISHCHPWQYDLYVGTDHMPVLLRDPQAFIQLDIDLKFSLPHKKKRYPYRARYKYDHEHQMMVRVESAQGSQHKRNLRKL